MMKFHPTPDDPAKLIVVPLEMRGGALVPFYGGAMPKLREGTVVDMLVGKESFADPDEVNRFDMDAMVTILPQETILYALLNLRRLLKDVPPNSGVKSAPSKRGDSYLVPFTIKEDLRLHLRGTKQAELKPCVCNLGPHGDSPTASVNEAYTRLSERYEKTRRSHTGNVFDKVFFTSPDGRECPLDDLRADATAELEKQLFHRSGELPLALKPQIRRSF